MMGGGKNEREKEKGEEKGRELWLKGKEKCLYRGEEGRKRRVKEGMERES